MNKREKIMIYILFSIIIGLDIIYQILSNYFATSGKELYDAQQQISRLRKENTLLETEILKKSSLLDISREAGRAGFVEGKFYFLH